jgi:hypothetical protein
MVVGGIASQFAVDTPTNQTTAAEGKAREGLDTIGIPRLSVPWF